MRTTLSVPEVDAMDPARLNEKFVDGDENTYLGKSAEEPLSSYLISLVCLLSLVEI